MAVIGTFSSTAGAQEKKKKAKDPVIVPTTAAQDAAKANEVADAQIAADAVSSGKVDPAQVPGAETKLNPDGLTGEKVRERARSASFTVRSAESALRAAASRIDVAWATFLPRLQLEGAYRRLSEFTPPSFGTGSLVGTLAPAGTLNPSPTVAVSLAFPIILDNFSLGATISVPLSDYLFKLSPVISGARRAEEAAKWEIEAARAKSGAEGALAFYSWLRARGSLIVATQALGDQRNHLADAKSLFQVAKVSSVDVLRAETAVSSAELQVEKVRSLVVITERQVRQAIQAAEGEILTVGESVEGPLPSSDVGTVESLRSEAMTKRPEMMALRATLTSTEKQATVARAAKLPSLSAYGNVLYANPNPRRVPQTSEWFATWELGVQLRWSPNDILLGGGNATELDARAEQVLAQTKLLADGIELELTQAVQGIKESDFALEASKRELASATETYRVSRELFVNGAATSTTLNDAETLLTKARLELVNAQIDARVARVKLNRALGRDIQANTIGK